MGAKDRPINTSIDIFIPLKSTILNTILRAFIKGFNNYEIRKEATRGIIFSDCFLYIIYSLAEKVRRINIEI